MRILVLGGVLVFALAACASQLPPQPTGDWSPVNHIDAHSDGNQGAQK